MVTYSRTVTFVSGWASAEVKFLDIFKHILKPRMRYLNYVCLHLLDMLSSCYVTASMTGSLSCLSPYNVVPRPPAFENIVHYHSCGKPFTYTHRLQLLSLSQICLWSTQLSKFRHVECCSPFSSRQTC